MQIAPITIQPWPLPRPEPVNGGIVPPWLQRDLGHEATQPTTHPTWRADFRK